MYSGLVHAHSGLRWIFLALIMMTIGIAIIKWAYKKPFWEEHKRWALFTFIVSHIQLLLGLVLYVVSPKVIFDMAAIKDSVSRFFLVEHLSAMLIAILLITLGYVKAKKQLPENSAKTIAIFYGIALMIILWAIPWPGTYGASWF
jgi:hypothetical protein